MARVPVYDGPQVATRALQTPMQREVDVSSGTRALGQAIGNIGVELDRGVRRDAETEANRVDNEITAGWLQWDAENRRKYQGQNVGEYETEATKWWDKARETYGANLSPLAQQAIGQQLARKRNQALGSVLSYVGAEKERFADDAGEKAALTSIEFGVDTGDTAGAALQVRKIVAERGARKGWTTEQVQADQQRLLGTLHLTAITTMAERDPTAARAYYDANKGEIPATAQPRVEQVLKAEGDNQFAKAEATRLYTMPADQRAAALAKISDPDRLTKTRTELQNIVAVEKAAAAEREAAASDEAWQMVGAGKRVPETVLMRMNGRERVQLQDYLRDRAKQAAAGTSVKTDPTLMARLLDTARDNPAEFARMRLEPLALKLGNSDIELVSRMQRDLLKPDKEKDVATTMQIIDAAGASLPTEPRSAFKLAVLDEIYRQESASGKPLGYKQKRDLAETMLISGEVLSGRWWQNDPNKKLYEVAPADRARFAPDDPARKQQVNALGAAPTTPVRVTSDDDYNKLPSGARFQAPDGTIRVKP